jgi:hypothetical protein
MGAQVVINETWYKMTETPPDPIMVQAMIAQHVVLAIMPQLLGEQAYAFTIVPDHFVQIAAAAAKDEQMTVVGIALRRLLSHQEQPVESPSACQCGLSPTTRARRSGIRDRDFEGTQLARSVTNQRVEPVPVKSRSGHPFSPKDHRRLGF